jgi:hypothetical protein
MTRTLTRTMASQAPGAGYWRRSHGDKEAFPLFCEALKTERRARRTHHCEGREVYPCTYGDHHLIAAPRHWHIGRSPDSL